MSWFFLFFFISGFCSVLYELVWLRLSMAQFGVTTAMVSIVLSVFMAGMGLGSWASGKWVRSRGGANFPALRIYAGIELLIGVSAIVAPLELAWGRRVLTSFGVESSFAYYCAAGLWVAGTMLPWCALMGATIPVAMSAIGQMFPQESGRSFSYLYTANVAGAVMGTALPLFLIELFGFHGALRAGALCNLAIAIGAMVVAASGAKAPSQSVAQTATLEALRHPKSNAASAEAVHSNSATQSNSHASGVSDSKLLVLLFLTGLTSMGMEVVWVREFTPYLGTVVYAFATILAVYLGATFIGSRLYRRWSVKNAGESPMLWTLLAISALLPLITSSPDTHLSKGMRLILGIASFTGLLGFLTPMLVDRRSAGNPARAGSAYAVNVLGCIAGPLVAGFALLPYLSERWALVALAAPWLIVGLAPKIACATRPTLRSRIAVYTLLPVAAAVFYLGPGYDEQPGRSEVRRDSTATVIAKGVGMRKELLVNGYGMTALTPVTKMMAHLPLAFLDQQPHDALDICFGMGTTFRSLMSWNIHVSVAELVPSVPRSYGYFHADGPALLQSPQAHLVIDDGRRYLERTSEKYDLITIDPPPPVEAAGSSLLYSEEFYAAAKPRLKQGAILAQWLPEGDEPLISSVAQAIKNSFPYVRVFRWSDDFGYYFFASDHALPKRTAEELAARVPAAAAADLVEWGPEDTTADQFNMILQTETTLDKLIALSPATPPMRDDRPINEYYVLRRWRYGHHTVK